MEKLFFAFTVAMLVVLLLSSLASAWTPPGQRNYEGQLGNQGCYHQSGQQGYEGQPGNQGGK